MTTQDKLKQLMAERGLNTATLAAQAQAAGHDVSVNTIAAWYYGRREPRGRGLRILADVLDVQVDELLGDMEAAS